MYYTYRLMVFGLLLLHPAAFAAPTSGDDDDIYAVATDARSLELPAPHPSLVDWREFLNGPLPGPNPESHRPFGECLSGYWTYLDRRTVHDLEEKIREFFQINPILRALRNQIDFTSQTCLKDWNTRKQMCYDKLKDRVRVEDVERAARFDAYWDAVFACMRRASGYKCEPPLFPALSKSFSNICLKQHKSLLPQSLVIPAPGSGFRAKWSSPVAAVASEAKAISVPESGVTQPESRSQAMLHHVGTTVQALVGNSHHVMERIWKAGPAFPPLLNRLAHAHTHAHAPAPAVPLKAFEY
ncbi:MAG: hypothetical protein M1826_007141 [Phylliscum demangeonii]|nr:MAG: hypothetical protein M1826_007141 [Phylliscum demangeonii]